MNILLLRSKAGALKVVDSVGDADLSDVDDVDYDVDPGVTFDHMFYYVDC